MPVPTCICMYMRVHVYIHGLYIRTYMYVYRICGMCAQLLWPVGVVMQNTCSTSVLHLFVGNLNGKMRFELYSVGT